MNDACKIISFIRQLTGVKDSIQVSEYCYKCLFNNTIKKKTLILFPKQLESKGIITIHKPLSEITYPDIIKKYTKLKR